MIHNFAILLTCFNRKETTIKCLSALYSQEHTADMDVFLCDDASTDGTGDAVRKQFPQVNVIEGNGKLFWNRGMLKAWQTAKSNKDYDAYIWLNDDSILYDGSIQSMIDSAHELDYNAIICGEFKTSKGKFSYGGKDKERKPIPPNGTYQPLYYLNGNCVLVPRYAVEKIGLLDPMFLHSTGDYDYGFRAQKAGIKVVTTKEYIGECEENPNAECRDRKDGLTVIGRFKRLYSPFGYNPIMAFRYNCRHWGLKEGVRIFLRLHYHNILSDNLFHKLIKR